MVDLPVVEFLTSASSSSFRPIDQGRLQGVEAWVLTVKISGRGGYIESIAQGDRTIAVDIGIRIRIRGI